MSHPGLRVLRVLEPSAEAFLTAQCASHKGRFAAQAIVDIMSDNSRPPGAAEDPIPEVEARGDS